MYFKYRKLTLSVFCLGICISALGGKSDFVKLSHFDFSKKQFHNFNKIQDVKSLSPENKALFEATARKTYAALGYDIKDMEKFTLGYQFLMERPLNDENIGRFIENLNVVAKLTKPTPDNKNFINSFVEAAQDNKFTEIELSNLDKIIENNTDGAIFSSEDSGIENMPQIDVSIGLDIGNVMNIYVASSLKLKSIK